jgi:predicted N-acetyltransferase YhbS
MEKIILRQEIPEDYQLVEKVVEEAFKTAAFSDDNEHLLVARLRMSDAFVPELSIVAEFNGEIVGHILLTKIKIKNEKQSFDSLALAPVSVKPDFQNKGIGGQLICEAHAKAKVLGFKSVVLLGHENYYPRFGYEWTSKYGISLPFEAPEQNCMVIALIENALEGVSGIVEYAKEFNI